MDEQPNRLNRSDARDPNVLADSEQPASNDSRRSSRWDLRNAPKNYFWLILFQGGSTLFTFGTVWLITHSMGTEGYGAVFAVIAASQIAQIFTNWTTVAVVKYGVEEFVEKAVITRTFWSRFLILAINSIVMVALANLWYPLLADWLKLAPQTFSLVLSLFLLSALWLHVQMGLQAVKRLREQGYLQMIERFIIFAGTAGLLFTGHLTVENAVVCYIVAAAAMTFAGIYLLRHFIFARFTFNWIFIKKTLLYSLPLLPYWVVGYLSGNYIDAAFISKFLSHSDLGIYAVATQVNGIAMQVPTLANTILLPLLLTIQSESGTERSWTYFRNILPGLVLAWGAGCAMLGFMGYLLLPALFRAEFSAATVPMWILLAGSVFWIPVSVGYAALANARSATYMSLVASSVSAVVNLSANFYLIPRYGMAGCAWATLLAYAACVLVFAVLLKRVEGMPISWTFLACIPSLAGAIVVTYIGFPVWGLIVCFGLTLVVGIFKNRSVVEMVRFLTTFRRAAHATDQAA